MLLCVKHVGSGNCSLSTLPAGMFCGNFVVLFEKQGVGGVRGLLDLMLRS